MLTDGISTPKCGSGGIESGRERGHSEAMTIIDDVIRNGEIARENQDKANIDYKGYRVSIKKQLRDDKGNVIDKKNWVVTAFDKKRSIKEKERVSSSETLTTPPTNQTADGVTLPPNETRSEGKDTTASSNVQENVEKTTESGELLRQHPFCHITNNLLNFLKQI